MHAEDSIKRPCLLRRTFYKIISWILSLTLLFMMAVGAVLWHFQDRTVDLTEVSYLLLGNEVPLYGGRIQWRKLSFSFVSSHELVPSEIRVKIDQVSVLDSTHSIVDRSDNAQCILALWPLLHGIIAIHEIYLDKVQASIKRGNNGVMLPEGSFPLLEHSLLKKHSSHKAYVDSSSLRFVQLKNSVVSFREEKTTNAQVLLNIPQVKMVRSNGGEWQGNAQGDVQWGGYSSFSHVTISCASLNSIQWSLYIRHIVPAYISSLLPEYRSVLETIQLPINISLSGKMVKRGDERHLQSSLHMDIGEGDYVQKDVPSIHVLSGAGDLSIESGKGVVPSLSIRTADIRFSVRDSLGKSISLAVGASGDIDNVLHPQNIEVFFQGALSSFDFARLASIWPQGGLRGVRRWMTENITQGVGKRFTLRGTLQSHSGVQGMALRQVQGDLYGEDMSITWLRPVQPITHVNAHAYFLDPDHIQINVKNGSLADGKGRSVQLPDGHILLSGLMKKDQIGEFHLKMGGSLGSFLSILAHPRLHILSKHPVHVIHPEGMIQGALFVALPLDSRVTINDIHFGADAECRDVSALFGNIFTVSRGKGRLLVTENDLTFRGGAIIQGIPVSGAVKESFLENSPGRSLQHAEVHFLLQSDFWKRYGLAKVVNNSVSGTALYEDRGEVGKHHRADLEAHFDFNTTGIHTPIWSKPAGKESAGHLHAVWSDGKLKILDQMSFLGADALLYARGLLKGDEITGVEISHMKIGHTEGKGSILWPVSSEKGSEYSLKFTMNMVDLAPLFQSTAISTRSSSSYPVMSQPFVWPTGNWDVQLHTEHFQIHEQHEVGITDAHIAWQQGALREAFVQVHASKDGQAIFSLNRNQKVSLHIERVGDFITALGEYSRFSGGTLSFNGYMKSRERDDARETLLGEGVPLQPLYGEMSLAHMSFRHPPSLVKMATFFAPLHWGELQRDCFEDISAHTYVTVQNRVFRVHDAVVHNDILGSTVDGSLDLGKDQIALKGTVSPLFGLNRIAPRLFGDKTWVAPEKGSGLLAFTYMANGTFERPSVRVNPFAVLLPGVLRNVVQ